MVKPNVSVEEIDKLLEEHKKNFSINYRKANFFVSIIRYVEKDSKRMWNIIFDIKNTTIEKLEQSMI